MFNRIWVLFIARNKEFYRDRSSFLWNIIFPMFIIIGFSFMFSSNDNAQYKAAVFHKYDNKPVMTEIRDQYIGLKSTKFIEFIDYQNLDAALEKLNHHRVDIVIAPETGVYWVNRTSPKSYMAERLLIAAGAGSSDLNGFKKETVNGSEVKYIEWLFPGIIAMNMMFSALFGVGFVVVRYRKNGVLKRFACTPLKPHEFLIAQIISRLFVILSTTIFVFIVISLLFDIKCRGSYLSLLTVFVLGVFSIISMGLVIASRTSSEEFANGIMNLITWPMMFLSEVWFSLEGSNDWILYGTKLFPLTYVVDGMRKIMNDGASLADIKINLIVLAAMSIVFTAVGSLLFNWSKE
ncbi:MAG: ABC transporter permease [Spirochaetes bacterium]|nr:ABC transporter permease [Spirochaetota bacterium]